MSLSYLNILNFRNLASVEFTPISQGFNYIQGKNGSGKTSILETIYYLSLAKSFRSTLSERVIAHDHDKLCIFAHFLNSSDSTLYLGLERHRKGDLKLRLNEQCVKSISEFADLMPVQLINSACHQLLEGGPLFRRQYLDWGIFYLNQDFLRLWKQYNRALNQRNAGLRGQVSKNELEGWTIKLIQSALRLDLLRRTYVESLIPRIEKILASFFPLTGLTMTYSPGWNPAISYQEILEKSFINDRDLGYTQWGPHRADLKLLINNIPIKDILSRGQQKLFVCAMIIARGDLLQSRMIKRPIYLIDDLPAELDITSRSSLIALLSKQEAQIFITAAENNGWYDFETSSSFKMFHVEHGKVLTTQ